MTSAVRIIGVVGAGIMGRGVAQAAISAGVQTRLFDASQEALEHAEASIGSSLDRAVEKGRLDQTTAIQAKARLCAVSEMRDLASCDLVLEAGPESLEIKHTIFRQLEDVVAADTLLASNTSSLSLDAIAQILREPARFAGLHFFNPAHVMQLVEIGAAARSAPSTIERLVTFAEAIGKSPVRCADTPGFVVNRCARPFYGEAFAILAEGRFNAAEIDAACRSEGYKVGPFALVDLVGADIHLAVTESVAAAFGGHPRYHVFEALREAVAAGRLGAKSGRGFATPAVETPAPQDAPAIVRRIEATLVNEAASLAQTGVSERDIDVAMRLGLNFPRGPFEIADAIGRAAIVEQLRRLEAAAPAALRGRYEPVAYLLNGESA